VAQLIGVLAAPLLSRLYTPEEFGVIGSVMAVVGVLSVVSSLKYEMALVVEKDNAKAQALQVLCWRILLVTTALAGLGILSAPLWLSKVSDDVSLLQYLPWAIPIIFLTGLFNIYNFRLNRERKYKDLSLALLTRRVSLVVSQVIFGFCGAQALGLALGNLVGCFLAVVVLLVSNRALLSFKGTKDVDLREVAREHYRFPIYSAPQNLLNSLSQNLPIYLLGYFYGMEVVGAYWFAMRLLQMPAVLVGQAVRQVFYKEAADLVDNLPKLRRLYVKTTLALAGIVVLPVLVIFLWGTELFTFCFGADWELAGEFSRWMFLWVGLLFVNPPSVMLFSVLSLQKYSMIFDVILLLCRLSALVVGGILLNAISTVMLYSIVGVVFNIIVILFMYRILRVQKNKSNG